MLNRNLLAALMFATASSVAFAAPGTGGASDSAATSDRPATQVVEGKAACTAQVEGTARQTAEVEACNQYESPNGGGY
jgi:hypothetical protein